MLSVLPRQTQPTICRQPLGSQTKRVSGLLLTFVRACREEVEIHCQADDSGYIPYNLVKF